MKQRVMISAGSQSFEFLGEITELNDECIMLKADKGDIYIERKYLVFIQFLEEELLPEVKPAAVKKANETSKLINQRLKKDPLDERLAQKLIPPSQFPDDDEEFIDASNNVNEDIEAVKNIVGHAAGSEHPFVKAANLKQAVKAAMSTEDFSMGNGSVDYQNPLQTILSIKNANNKKTRNS